MGTHIYFYQPASMTQEEAKQSCLEKLREWLFYDHKNTELIQRMIRMVEKDLCQKAVWNWQKEMATLHNDKPYLRDENAPCLRVPGKLAGEIVCFLDEMLQLIKQENLGLKELSEEWLKEYWEKHPNTIVIFL